MNKIQEYLDSGVRFYPAVVGYLRRGDEILLGLRKEVSLGLGHNLIAGIGGKVGDVEGLEEETNEDALRREFPEEVGVEVLEYSDFGRVRFIFPHKPKWNHNVRIYIVEKWSGKLKETSAIKPIWFKINDLPGDRMWDDNLYWLPQVLNGEKVDCIFLYEGDNQVAEYIFY